MGENVAKAASEKILKRAEHIKKRVKTSILNSSYLIIIISIISIAQLLHGRTKVGGGVTNNFFCEAAAIRSLQTTGNLVNFKNFYQWALKSSAEVTERSRCTGQTVTRKLLPRQASAQRITRPKVDTF